MVKNKKKRRNRMKKNRTNPIKNEEQRERKKQHGDSMITEAQPAKKETCEEDKSRNPTTQKKLTKTTGRQE